MEQYSLRGDAAVANGLQRDDVASILYDSGELAFRITNATIIGDVVTIPGGMPQSPPPDFQNSAPSTSGTSSTRRTST